MLDNESQDHSDDPDHPFTVQDNDRDQWRKSAAQPSAEPGRRPPAPGQSNPSGNAWRPSAGSYSGNLLPRHFDLICFASLFLCLA